MKSKRTVTVDSSSYQEEDKPSRRQSVFDRLGPGALPASTKERHPERQEKCRNWLRKGECSYGNLCKYEHKPLSSKHRHEASTSSERRKKSKIIQDDNRSRSPSSPSKKYKHDQGSSNSYNNRLDFDTKLKSTIVKPKSPDSERFSKHEFEKKGRKGMREVLKKPLEQQWEEDEQDDSDDWDATKLDHKEAVALEMKRQELQRQLEIEIRNEGLLKSDTGHDVDRTSSSKKVVSCSSSSSSSSRSSSASSSSVSSSSSSSSSDSGSDSDSSGSSSDSSPRAKKSSRTRQKSQSPSPYQRKSKRMYDKSPSTSERSAKNISRGPRTPSPVKSQRSKNEYESHDLRKSDGKGKYRNRHDDEDQKRYSGSPATSYASTEVNRERTKKKDESRSGYKKTSSISPPRSYSRREREQIESAKSHNQSSRKHVEPSRTSSRDRHSKDEPESYKRTRSPSNRYSRKDDSNRSISPKVSYSSEKLKYGSDKNRSISPSRIESSSRERGREISGKTSREASRHRDQLSPSRSRTHDAKSKYPYFDESEHRRGQSPRSPDRRRRDFRDAPPSSSHDRLPPPEAADALIHDRRKDKLHEPRNIYSEDSPHSRRLYEDEYMARDGRNFRDNYRDSEFQRLGLHEREYIGDPLRERDLAFRNIEGRRDPHYLPELHRERDYGRPDYPEREFYDMPYGIHGHRDGSGRNYAAHVEPDERRRDPVYDLPGRERMRDRFIDPRDRIGDRERYPPVLPGEELDHRHSRPGQYIPDDERAKRDWALHYPDYPEPDRYRYCRMDYPIDPTGAKSHGWDHRPRDINRDRDLYYGGRHQRLENEEVANSRRREGSSSYGWDSLDYQGKRGFGDKDQISRRERDKEQNRDRDRDRNRDRDNERVRDRDGARDKVSSSDGGRDSDRYRDQDRNASDKTKTLNLDSRGQRDRRDRKRNRSLSSERQSEQNAQKRPRNSENIEKGRSDSRLDSESNRNLENREYRSDRNKKEKSRSRSPHRSEEGSQNDGEMSDKVKTDTDLSREDRSTSQVSSKCGSSVEDKVSNCDKDSENDYKHKYEAEGNLRSKSKSNSSHRSLNDKKSRSEHSGKDDNLERTYRRESRSSKNRDSIKDSHHDYHQSSESSKRGRENDSKDNDGLSKNVSNSPDKDTVLGSAMNESSPDNIETWAKDSSCEQTDISKSSTVKDVKDDDTSDIDMNAEDSISLDAGSHRSISPTLEISSKKNDVIDMQTDQDTEINQSSIDGDKKNDEELSEWSDGDDELLTRDEIDQQVEDDKISDKADSINQESTKASDKLGPSKKPRVEELKADHKMRSSSRSSSADRHVSYHRTRSLSSERSRGSSREDKRESRPERGRKRRRDQEDKQSHYRSRSGSRNTSEDKNKSESSNEQEFSKSRRADKVDNQNAEKEDVSNVANFDYDPISDDELEAMIEEPSDSLTNEAKNTEARAPGIVDALNVDWASLMGTNEGINDKPLKNKATERFKPGKIFSEIGFSVKLVTPELADRIKDVCTKELQKEYEKSENFDENKPVKFELKHDIAALHAAAVSQKKEREHVFSDIGPYRRALCARQDLQIRRKLCRYHNRLPDHLSTSVSTTQHNIDPELYQMSVKLFKNALQQSPAIF